MPLPDKPSLAVLPFQNIESWREAIALLRRVLALDPSYAPAAGLFAWCRARQKDLRAISDEEAAEGVPLARQAIESGKEDPDALCMGGFGLAVLAGERASGLRAIERALAFNPNSALAWNFCGWLHCWSNRPDSAIEALHRAIRLSPLDPQRWVFYGGLALAHLVAGAYEEAIEWADRALHENPRATAVLGVHGYKAAACGYLGRIQEGHECVRAYRELRPGSTMARLERFYSPEVLAFYLDGLRKAGVPEE